MMTAKCEAKTEATVSGGSPRVRRSRPGPNMRLLFAGVDKNRTPAEQRARIPSIIFNEKKFPEKTIPGGGHGKPFYVCLRLGVTPSRRGARGRPRVVCARDTRFLCARGEAACVYVSAARECE